MDDSEYVSSSIMKNGFQDCLAYQTLVKLGMVQLPRLQGGDRCTIQVHWLNKYWQIKYPGVAQDPFSCAWGDDVTKAEALLIALKKVWTEHVRKDPAENAKATLERIEGAIDLGIGKNITD